MQGRTAVARVVRTLLCLSVLIAVVARAESPSGRATRVVVVPLTTSGGIDPKAAEVLTSVLVAELSDRGVAVVTSKDVETALEIERRKEVLGQSSGRRLGEISAAMGTDKIVSGSLAMMGGYKVITIQLFDSKSGAVERVFQEQLERAETDDLLEAGSRAGEQLFPGSVRASGGVRRLRADAASIRLRSHRDVACSVDGGLKFAVVKDREEKVPVNVGQRVVRCSTLGYSEFVERLDLGPGATKAIEVQMYDLAAARSGRRWGWVSVGLATVGAGAAAYGFWQAHDAYDKLHGSSAPTTWAGRQSTIDRGQLGNKVGVVGSAALGLGATLATYFFVFSY